MQVPRCNFLFSFPTYYVITLKNDWWTVNPFIAVRSLENDHYTPFCFLFRNGISVKGFSSKRIALAIEPENILSLQERPSISFNPEILQAGAVKGLISITAGFVWFRQFREVSCGSGVSSAARCVGFIVSFVVRFCVVPLDLWLSSWGFVWFRQLAARCIGFIVSWGFVCFR